MKDAPSAAPLWRCWRREVEVLSEEFKIMHLYRRVYRLLGSVVAGRGAGQDKWLLVVVINLSLRNRTETRLREFICVLSRPALSNVVSPSRMASHRRCGTMVAVCWSNLRFKQHGLPVPREFAGGGLV